MQEKIKYEELNKLFNKVVKVFEIIGEELCLDTIIQCPIENTMFSKYSNQVSYVYSANGTISNTSPFSAWSVLNIRKETDEPCYGFEDMFAWYCGNLKDQMIKNCIENKGISIINFFDCYKGDFNYSIEIENEEDFKRYLIGDMALLDCGYEEEEIDSWLKD